MAKSVVAFSLNEFDPSYTRVLIGNADFRYNDFTNLGTLEVITGNASFNNSQVENLGNLTTIGGNVYFSYSQVADLGNLTTIKGIAYFENSQVENLGNLTTIGRDANFQFSELKDLGNLITIGENAYFENSQVENLGSLTTIGRNAYFNDSQVKSLGNLTTIGGYVNFEKNTVENLGKLTTIGGNAYFRDSQIKDLGQLTTIGGDADFLESKIKNLGNLTTIGGSANFLRSKIQDLGNLTTIDGSAYFNNSQVKNLGNLTTIGQDTNFQFSELKDLGNLITIGGTAVFGQSEIKDLGKLTTIGRDANFYQSQIMDLRNLETIGRNAYFNDSEVKSLGNLRTILGNADFWDSQVENLGNLTTIGGYVNFGDRKDLEAEWEKISNKDNFKTGGQPLSKTPAPKKDRVYGSKKNKPESSKDTKSAEKIEFSGKTLETIKNKVAEHNEKNPKKKVTLASAKAVVRRGMGAYSSTHRPTISGGKPNSRVAWGLARLNAFFYKIINGKSKSGKYSQDDDLINELGYKVAKYVDGGEVANIMRNEIIDILSKNARYGKQIRSVQEVGLEVIESCIESNTYFGNGIRQANENYIMIPVNYEDKLWAIDKKVGYVYFAKPNENTKIRVEYKYDMQDYPVPILFDSEIMNNEEFYDVNDYEEIKSYKFDSEFLYRGINNDEMLSIIQNGFIKSNASMNIGKQQEETTSFAQDISQASSYAVGFNAWYDEVTFAKPKYILKVKKEGVNYKPTIETDIENEVDVFGEIPIQQIESIYEFRLGECEMGQVEIIVGYDNDFSDGSRSPMFKKVFVRKTDINSIIKSNKIQKYIDGGFVMDEEKGEKFINKLSELGCNKPLTNFQMNFFGFLDSLKDDCISLGGFWYDSNTTNYAYSKMGKMVLFDIEDFFNEKERTAFIEENYPTSTPLEIQPFDDDNYEFIGIGESSMGGVFRDKRDGSILKLTASPFEVVGTTKILNAQKKDINYEDNFAEIYSIQNIGKGVFKGTWYYKYYNEKEFDGNWFAIRREDITPFNEQEQKEANCVKEIIVNYYSMFGKNYQPEIFGSFDIYEPNREYKYLLRNRNKYSDGGLIAPNGKPSNLTPEQYKLVRTPAFKEWFGDWENDPENSSKVVDENGEPLVVYHGTNSQFNVFDKSQQNKATGFGDFGAGFYFTASLGSAKYYTLKQEENRRVISVFLKIVKPFVVELNWEKLSNQSEINYKKLKGFFDWEKDIIKNGLLDEYRPSKKITKEFGDNRFQDILLVNGYDGVFVHRINISEDKINLPNQMFYFNEIVAFESNQIKLADGTNTTFDGNNPDIRFMAGGVPKKRRIKKGA